MHQFLEKNKLLIDLIPNINGTYILIFLLAKDKTLKIGKLGIISFKKGYYAYAGFAMGSLKKRIKFT